MNIRHIIAILTGLIACAVCAHAQYADTFLVTVADKTPEHPYYGEGHGQGYIVNGLQSPTITLVRDSLYLFDTHEVPRNLVFSFYTTPIGGAVGIYNDHVEEHIVSKGLWSIKATDETPDTLYYASVDRPWMGGTILIVDSITSSVEERSSRHAISALAAVAYPNPFADETEFRFALDTRSAVRLQVVDALGRVVLTRDAGVMEQGEGDIRLSAAGLDAGVYLYRIEALSESMRSVATGKVQVVR